MFCWKFNSDDFMSKIKSSILGGEFINQWCDMRFGRLNWFEKKKSKYNDKAVKLNFIWVALTTFVYTISQSSPLVSIILRCQNVELRLPFFLLSLTISDLFLNICSDYDVETNVRRFNFTPNLLELLYGVCNIKKSSENSVLKVSIFDGDRNHQFWMAE